MARIVKRKTKRGLSYQATIRRKGFDTVTRTFDTKKEALIGAAATEHGADPFDTQDNITGGTKYLRSLLDSYAGVVELGLATYNAGPDNGKNAIPNFPETRTYMAKVLDNYQSYRALW